MKHRFKKWLANKIFKNEFEYLRKEMLKLKGQNENLKEQLKYIKLENQKFKFTKTYKTQN